MNRLGCLVLLGLSACSSSSGTPSPDVGPIDRTVITGTLGGLGAVQATMTSLWISNSGETLVYLSSDSLACADLTTSRWLGGTTAGTQVIELVIQGAPKLETYDVPSSEINYAAGAMSSATEKSVDDGAIAFTRADADVVEGTIMATIGAQRIDGVFHATFCAGGQGY